jgi:hypothetical protein
MGTPAAAGLLFVSPVEVVAERLRISADVTRRPFRNRYATDNNHQASHPSPISQAS